MKVKSYKLNRRVYINQDTQYNTMSKVIIPQMGLDVEVFNAVEQDRKAQKMPRATYINQKLREMYNL